MPALRIFAPISAAMWALRDGSDAAVKYGQMAPAWSDWFNRINAFFSNNPNDQPKLPIQFGIGTDEMPADLILPAETLYWIVPPGGGGVLFRWDLTSRAPSVGADIKIDAFKVNNANPFPGVSLFGITKATLPAGQLITQTGTIFDPVNGFVEDGDRVYGKMLQIGTTAPGKGASLHLYWE